MFGVQFYLTLEMIFGGTILLQAVILLLPSNMFAIEKLIINLVLFGLLLLWLRNVSPKGCLGFLIMSFPR